MVLILKILTAYFKMRLGKVQHEANLKVLKAPSPSPHPAATVGVGEGLLHSIGILEAGRREVQREMLLRVINISSQTVSSWSQEQLTACSLPLKAQSKEAPWSISTRKFLFFTETLHQLNTCINNSTQKKPTADARKSDEDILNQTEISTRKNKRIRGPA